MPAYLFAPLSGGLDPPSACLSVCASICLRFYLPVCLSSSYPLRFRSTKRFCLTVSSYPRPLRRRRRGRFAIRQAVRRTAGVSTAGAVSGNERNPADVHSIPPSPPYLLPLLHPRLISPPRPHPCLPFYLLFLFLPPLPFFSLRHSFPLLSSNIPSSSSLPLPASLALGSSPSCIPPSARHGRGRGRGRRQSSPLGGKEGGRAGE